MKVSYNWIKDYLDIDKPADEMAEILTNIGLEIEGVEQFESIPGSLEGLIVGEVLSCEKHPDSDHLHITRVDYGEEPVQIICGAPNVAKGQKVVVAKVGTTLYPADGDPFKIKKAKIRGESSYGMICAEDEIGLGSNHDGIMVLDPETTVGTPAVRIFPVTQDTIFEIGLTPNRSDATSHIGVAKDILAYLRVNEKYSKKLKLPTYDNFQAPRTKPQIEVEVEDLVGCPRFSGVVISNITVKDSPQWIKDRLRAIGVRPINNIVDITNYVLHEWGQPLHAYNLSAIKGDKIIVKNLPDGTKFKSLDEVERKLYKNDVIVCDGDSNPMCIGGVFGGFDSGVSESTTEIFLEAAHFNAKRIRRTSMSHLLRTDAAMRFEKGSDPSITVDALKRAALLITEFANGDVSSPIVDNYPKKIEPRLIDVRYRQIHKILGIEIEKGEIRDILNALEIGIEAISDHQVKVSVPTNKSDVTREIDVIEEILRIYGFNRIPVDNYISYSYSSSDYPSRDDLYNKVSNYLSAQGFNECMSMSINTASLYEEVLPYPSKNLVKINNTSNIHLDTMRANLIPGMLENVLHNQNRQNQNLQLFEFGNIYKQIDENNFYEEEYLILAVSGEKADPHWMTSKENNQFSFYSLKGYVLNLLQVLGLSGKASLEPFENDKDAFEYGISIRIDEEIIGTFWFDT